MTYNDSMSNFNDMLINIFDNFYWAIYFYKNMSLILTQKKRIIRYFSAIIHLKFDYSKSFHSFITWSISSMSTV